MGLSAKTAQYIWYDGKGRGRNRVALFRRTFSVVGARRACLSLFADTRYRLIVNGEAVGHGPGRFVPEFPEYDTYDIAPYLRPGKNVIAVVVHSHGCLTHHSRVSIGGLIAWGDIEDKTGQSLHLTTDTLWRAIESPAHHPETHELSAAMGPAEFLDLRERPEGWDQPDFDDTGWPFAVPIAIADRWGALHARSIPLLDERSLTPRRLCGAWVASQPPGEDLYSMMVTTAGGKGDLTDARISVMTHIHSPRSQEVVFGSGPGRHWVNGQEVHGESNIYQALRLDYRVRFKKGWNVFQVYETVRQGWWDFYLALPKEAGLSVSADRQIDSPHIFLIGGPWEEKLAVEADRMTLPLTAVADLPETLGGWRPWPRDRKAETPARERAWKTLVPVEWEGQAANQSGATLSVAALAKQVNGNTLSLLYDFGGEVFGRPMVEFKAAAGTVVDVGTCERVLSDGVADMHARGEVQTVERCIARQGRQRWHALHPRGFRFVELLITGKLEAFELSGVSVTRSSYPVQRTGEFECSDPTLNAVWRMCRRTAETCMEDAFIRAPGSDRGVYPATVLGMFPVALACFGDARLMRRCIELLFQAQGDDGLVPAGAHGESGGNALHSSLFMPQLLWQYWRNTGDTPFVKNMLPPMSWLIEGLAGHRGESELLEGIHGAAGTTGIQGQCVINCLYHRACRDAQRVARVAGEEHLAGEYANLAHRTAEAISQRYWDPSREVFIDGRVEHAGEAGPSVLANALPVLYGIAKPEQAANSMVWILEALRRHFECPEGARDWSIAPRFGSFILSLLFRQGCITEAEQFIRCGWGRMLDRGATTGQEEFGENPASSACFGPSSAPAYFLSRYALGVSFPEPANPNRVEVRPQPGSLKWARGAYPHPNGVIRVEWRLRNGRLMVDGEAPEGVEVAMKLPTL